MVLSNQSGTSEDSIGFQSLAQHVSRNEQLITILATSLGVMIVAAIAVLMGMA